MSPFMTKYREIIRLSGLGLSQTNIALSCNASKTTVNKVLKAARKQRLLWPLDSKLTDPVLGKLLFPDSKAKPATSKRMPDYEHIRKLRAFRKDDRIQEIISKTGKTEGMIHIFSAMEQCNTYKPWYDKTTRKTFLKFDQSKCLHYYFYFIR